MSHSAGTFHCPACAAGFTWKVHFAGRRMRCKCGEVFVPSEPPAVVDPDPYSVGEEVAPSTVKHTTVARRPPAPAPAIPPAYHPPPAGVAPVSGAIPASVAALYGRKSSRYAAEQEDGDSDDGTPLKGLYIPLAMLAVGLVLRVSQLVFANANRANKWAATGDGVAHPGRAVLLALCETVIATFIMACGAAVAAMLLNINFGSVGRAALKLAGTAVFATGVACWVAVFDQDRHSVGGLAVALHLVVIIYWIALGYLFSLELQETMLTVAIISVLQAAVMCVLWRA